jgi:hypothetical protein
MTSQWPVLLLRLTNVVVSLFVLFSVTLWQS